MEEELVGHTGFLIESLGSEVVPRHIGKPFETHMAAGVVVGFGWTPSMGTESRSSLVELHKFEAHILTDPQMLNADTQQDCRAEGPRRSYWYYRYKLASYYLGIQALSIVAGCRKTGLSDAMVHLAADSHPDSMRRMWMGRTLSALP